MILHIDMDAFYASVEQLDDPELNGQCVIVGGKSKRSVVSAASYEARKFGVHSAMPIFQARQKCPHGIIVPPRMGRYKQLSERIMRLLAEFTPLVEVISIDEAFMDISGCGKLHGSPVDIGFQIKKTIRETVHLSCSIGIAPNKFLAKIASDMDKPDGLTIIRKEEVPGFIETLPIQKVPGVGRKTGEQLELMGIKTLGEIKHIPEKMLFKKMGKFGQRLKQLAAGIDDSEVTPFSPVKSVSSEKTLSEDTRDIELLKNYLLQQSEIVAIDLRKKGLRAKTITVKIKYADFKTATKRVTVAVPTCSSETVFLEAEKLFTAFGLKTQIRLIGVGASSLVPASVPVQAGLFEVEKKGDRTWEKVDKTVDRIKTKYGREIIKRANLKK
jgi:DNA polymerase IV